jgi:hypothetical protein
VEIGKTNQIIGELNVADLSINFGMPNFANAKIYELALILAGAFYNPSNQTLNSRKYFVTVVCLCNAPRKKNGSKLNSHKRLLKESQMKNEWSFYIPIKAKNLDCQSEKHFCVWARACGYPLRKKNHADVHSLVYSPFIMYMPITV